MNGNLVDREPRKCYWVNKVVLDFG